ncbi:MAG TPA: beta-1,6-N-acetylglucosaminyltransferase [Thermoanaerobaculia bacterium]|nr:beta-1,6-N-acetylglucosaminyltransferase [Thermoanaerobaculia bacterium]
MSCCYLVQSHCDPAQVLRLVRTVKRCSPGAPVLVVHDGRTVELDPRPFETIPGVKVLVRHDRVARGEWSVLSPLLAGLQELLGAEGGRPKWSFDWLVYLSGQDYPVRTLADFETSLSATRSGGFLAWWDVLGPESPWRPRQGRTRYYSQYTRLPDWTMTGLKAGRFLGKISPLRFHLHYGPFVGWEPRRTPFEGPVRCYGGSQWWTLSRPCVEHLWQSIRSEDRLVRWFRRTVAPCEAMVQTVLVNSGKFELTPDNRRYTDFAGSKDGRPRTLKQSDLPLVAAGRFDFARKFDMARDPELLDLIDNQILGL